MPLLTAANEAAARGGFSLKLMTTFVAIFILLLVLYDQYHSHQKFMTDFNGHNL